MTTSASKALVALVSFCAAATATVWAVVAGLDYAGYPYPKVAQDPVAQIDRVLVAASENSPSVPEVFFFGDSLSMGPGGVRNAPGLVGWQLERVLEEGLPANAQVKVWPIVTSGISLYTYYFVADRIIKTKPRHVVLQLNLFWFFDDWHRQIDRTGFVAWLPVSWWPEARGLSLHKTGLKFDRMLLSRMFSGTWAERAMYALQREQVRAQSWRNSVELALQGGSRVFGQVPYLFVARNAFLASRVEKGRSTKELAFENFGPVLGGVKADHSILLLLDAFLSRLVDAGIGVTAYVPPHNMEHLAKLGVSDFSGIESSIDQLAAVVQGHGGTFVDLHDLLPDAGFRDYLDHYADTDEFPSARMITERISKELLPQLAQDRDRVTDAVQ